MALTHFTFCVAAMRGSGTPAAAAGTFVSEGIVPSGSSQATTAVAPTTRGSDPLVCKVATDTAVYVSFGGSPDATVTASRTFLPAGVVEYYLVNPGDKAAVVTI